MISDINRYILSANKGHTCGTYSGLYGPLVSFFTVAFLRYFKDAYGILIIPFFATMTDIKNSIESDELEFIIIINTINNIRIVKHIRLITEKTYDLMKMENDNIDNPNKKLIWNSLSK